MELTKLVEIERTTLVPICRFARHPTYVTWKSERFPSFYAGNGIEILQAGQTRLAHWEAIFLQHFPRQFYNHKTFTFYERPEFETLASEARESDYHVDREVFMYRNTPPLKVASFSSECEFRRLSTAEEWNSMRTFDDKQSQDEDWYTGNDGHLFEKDRVVSDALSMEWYYLADRQTGRMLSKLAIFVKDGIGSIQEVMTDKAMRRQGLATALTGHVMRLYWSADRCQAFSLSADSDEDAIRVYRRLGFQEAGARILMMTYPGIETS